MEFFIVANAAFDTEEKTENLLQWGIRSVLGYHLTTDNISKKPKQITPAVLIHHLEQTPPFYREIYDNLDSAIKRAKEAATQLRDKHEIVLYGCEFSTPMLNGCYVGAHAKLPTNSFFMPNDQILYKHFITVNNKGEISKLDNVFGDALIRRKVEEAVYTPVRRGI